MGGSFSYQLLFPDPGIYWYHPHIREDYGQEMGLYGNIVVEPAEPDYWPPANRELALTLDDVLIEDGRVAPFSRTEPNYTAMGRVGNVLLTNGEPELSLSAQAGEVVRLYLTNTANTRVFNVALPGARMKLVGGDSGRVEREEFVETAMLAPSERVVVDVLFAEPGELTLLHRTPGKEYPLATIQVSDEQAEPSLAAEFEALRTNADMWPSANEWLRTWSGSPTRRSRSLPRWTWASRRCRRRHGHLHVSDASGGAERGARQVSRLRDEAARDRRRTDRLRLPDAPRGDERPA